jgi:hypothetical protein
MVTGQARVLQERDPRKVRIVYEKSRWHEAWEGNPRIARPGEAGDFQVLQPRDGYRRPYIAEKTEMQWTWRAYGPPRGELYFAREELKFAAQFDHRILIEPRLKPGASPNKDWGKARWLELVRLAALKGIRFAQCAPTNKFHLPGVEFIWTHDMRKAAAVVARARALVIPEGGLHHVAAAVGRPAVVIFGGYIAPAVTGYPEHRNLFTGGGLGCGMRVACKHCQAAMAQIEPAQVLEELEEIL